METLSNTTISLTALLIVMTGPCRADTHYVDASNSAPAAPYTTWAAAASDIQSAVDAADHGDTVLMADGTYYITSKIDVMKSVAVRSLNGAENTVVDAGGNCRVFTLSSSTGPISLEGLTLTGGYASHAVTLGGAVFAYGNSDIRIANCIVENNESPGSAGGINLNANAGKHITATVTNCLIRNNQAANRGGGIGINIDGSCQISISDCTIEGNTAQNGGGVFCNAANGWIDVSRCIISSNEAVQFAGGIRCQRNIMLTDSLIIGNRAGQRGGGEHGGADDEDSFIINCTIVGNRAPVGGGISKASVYNSVVHGNQAESYPEITPNSIVAFSCAPGLVSGVNGNINADPQFIDPASGDYRPLATSPCIDAGTNVFALSAVDLAWHPRIIDGSLNGEAVVDMGAYEFQVIPVEIDIKPGSDTNPINLQARGRIPVAILTTEAFDAAEVDPGTVRFAGAEPVHSAHEDVDADGDIDLLLLFHIHKLELSVDSSEAILTGQTFSGTLLTGTDVVEIIPEK
jgi:hypothetical protein